VSIQINERRGQVHTTEEKEQELEILIKGREAKKRQEKSNHIFGN
jgi:hypothetical protein